MELESEKQFGRFLVRVLRTGGRYASGRVHDGSEPIVEFLDTDNIDPTYAPRGQFVSSYYLETLAGHARGVRLDLHGGVPAWTVPAADMDAILDWFTELMRPARRQSLADALRRRRGPGLALA